jgi:hypothetical protein
MNIEEIKSLEVDELTCAIYLLVPKNQVVNLQAYFELYEGLGTLRTVSIRDSLVCIVCTKDLLNDCKLALIDLQQEINWRVAPKSAIAEEDFINSYGQKSLRKGKAC